MVVLYELVQLDETGRVCGPLLELHVVLDGLHALDVARELDRAVERSQQHRGRDERGESLDSVQG